jgi:LPXTG-motif cell wall-anchored protein
VVDGQEVGTTTANANGDWTLTPTSPLGDGTHTITATQVDPSGNASPASSPVVITVDTVADPPRITSPAAGSTTNDTTPTVTGTAEPGATVEVSIDGSRVGTATAGSTGHWSLPTATPLPEGPHTVSAVQTDPVGNVSEPASHAFVVDLTAPQAPVITSPADGDVTHDGTPAITGTGEPGSTVTVTVDGAVVGTATVTPLGTWTLAPASPLAPGAHTVSATQTDAAGNTSPAAAAVTFTVAPARGGSAGGDCREGRGSHRCPTGGTGNAGAGESDDSGLGGSGLADTGAAAGLGLLALLGTGAVGGGLLLVRRRRNGAHGESA